METKIESLFISLRGWKQHPDCDYKTERIKDIIDKLERLGISQSEIEKYSISVIT